MKGNPISIGITGGSPYFYLYSSGVLTDCLDYRSIDHAVVLVGASYDPNNLKESFLKIKNSGEYGGGRRGILEYHYLILPVWDALLEHTLPYDLNSTNAYIICNNQQLLVVVF